MAEKRDRSVFDRLDDIEDTLTPKEPLSVSEIIGEDFVEFINASTAYLYEADERKFAPWKRRKLIVAGAFATVMLILFALSIPVYIMAPCAGTILMLVGNLVGLINAGFIFFLNTRWKPKMKAASPLNIENQYFYVFGNCLQGETKKTVVCWLARILAVAAGIMDVIGGLLLICFGNLGSMDLIVIIFISFFWCLGYLFSWLSSLPLIGLYYYPDLIFDKPDCYVQCVGNKWSKVMK